MPTNENMTPDPLPPLLGRDFAKPLDAVLMPVIYYKLRGRKHLWKDTGQFRMRLDPGKAQYVLFFKEGLPVALAVCKGVTRELGDWIVEYANVRELNRE